MATWKKILTEDDVLHLGTSDITQTAGENRTYTVAPLKRLKFTADGGSNFATFEEIDIGSSVLSYAKFESDYVTFDSVFTIPMAAPGLTITSDAAGSSAGPTLTLTRDDNAPGVDNDSIGKIDFRGNKDGAGGPVTKYASIGVKIDDATAATAEGSLEIKLLQNNVFSNALSLFPVADGETVSDGIAIHNRTLTELMLDVLGNYKDYSLKMYAAAADNNGLGDNSGMLFRFNPMQPTNSDIGGIDNEAYIFNSGLMTNWESDTITLPYVTQIGNALFDQDGSASSGISDAWFTHERSLNASTQTLRITGSIWWKPKGTPAAGLKVKVFLGYTSVEGGDVSDATIAFTLEDISSSYTLATTEVIDKIDVAFTKVFGPNETGSDVTDLFIIGIKNDASGGALNEDPAVATVTGAFVADLHIRVSPT